MAIIAVRIDGRLIHGQVANLWAPKLGASRIMIVDDEVAKNDLQKAGLKLACPAGIKLSVLPVEKAAKNINDGKYDTQKLFIVANDPKPLLGLIEHGVNLKEINVGNLPKTEVTKEVTRSVYVTDEQIKTFEKINEHGIALISQMTPGESSSDFFALLSKVK